MWVKETYFKVKVKWWKKKQKKEKVLKSFNKNEKIKLGRKEWRINEKMNERPNRDFFKMKIWFMNKKIKRVWRKAIKKERKAQMKGIMRIHRENQTVEKKERKKERKKEKCERTERKMEWKNEKEKNDYERKEESIQKKERKKESKKGWVAKKKERDKKIKKQR